MAPLLNFALLGLAAGDAHVSATAVPYSYPNATGPTNYTGMSYAKTHTYHPGQKHHDNNCSHSDSATPTPHVYNRAAQMASTSHYPYASPQSASCTDYHSRCLPPFPNAMPTRSAGTKNNVYKRSMTSENALDVVNAALASGNAHASSEPLPVASKPPASSANPNAGLTNDAPPAYQHQPGSDPGPNPGTEVGENPALGHD